MRISVAAVWIVLAVSQHAGLLAAGDNVPFDRQEDVIYGRKYGVALTLDVFTPRPAKGVGVMLAVSGGWSSSHGAIHAEAFQPILNRGYTVFAVVHGSQPKFTIPEIAEDMHRAVRFIRHEATRFGIDPERLGIMGGSAGGHFSLLMGTSGRPADPGAQDPVDRESSRVQAVACFFPPTDFLNWGRDGYDCFQALEKELRSFKPPFDFPEKVPETGQLLPIHDHEKRMKIAREISPITHVTPDDPPTLIVHGDADPVVPLQQSQVMERRLKEAGVPVRLIVKPGAGHGWNDMGKDMEVLGDWFDEHLKKGGAKKG